ncbi:dystrophin-like [Anthonomus grandis grandis]|uniref:dystrophin-like n=1 Tax=Anthonomus grandis grandis TaxID=2921223 RepID=UPI0021660622|nr:dystrophin-like [Anthonomus grandis grandis]
MMGHWKKCENEKGFFYYFNTSTNKEQWDHPKYSEIKQALDDCNYIAFSSYRLAFKLRVLQRYLYTEEVPLSIISTIFQRHKLGCNEGSLTLETYDLEAVLSDIYFAANKSNHTNIDIDFATELLINFLYNVFDSQREGKIQVLPTKLLLGLLCNFSQFDLHRYIFSLCADHNNCITRTKLQGILHKIQHLLLYLHEENYFGTKSSNLAIERCFEKSPGLVGITEADFIDWFVSDIHYLSWIPIILKLKSSETVLHSSKCTTCKTRPILGLKYKCAKCQSYTQCQRCFLTARTSHSHKLTHSVREYSSVNMRKDIKVGFLQKLSKVLHPESYRGSYTVIKPSRQFYSELSSQCEPLYEIPPLSTPESQLQGVIRQLESQNRELQQMLIFGNYNDKELRKYLDEYRFYMAGNIKRLKVLKSQINNDFNKRSNCDNMLYDQLRSTESLNSMDRQMKSNVFGGKQSGGYKVNANVEDFIRDDPTTNDQLKLSHTGLDEALAKLQQILANNFSLEESLEHMDNTNLKFAVNEVEGMLNSIIDTVESSRCSSALTGKIKC